LIFFFLDKKETKNQDDTKTLRFSKLSFKKLNRISGLQPIQIKKLLSLMRD